MSATQQIRYGRHARLDEPAGSSPLPHQRPAPDAVAPLAVAPVAVAPLEDAGPASFGQWPFGTRRPDPDEPVGPNPYLPCEDSVPEVQLAPGGWPGTLALLAGLVGTGLALFPIIAIAVWPLAIIGIVLGVMGLRRVRAGSARNSVAAAAGIALSTIALVLCAVWVSMYAMAGVDQPATATESAVSAPR